LILVLHDTGEGDNAVIGLHCHMILQDGAEVIGGLGGVLDLEIG